jgi:hypothetical protein
LQKDLVVVEKKPGMTWDDAVTPVANTARGAFVAVMAGRDFYGEHYLLDSLVALELSGADIVGKKTHFFYAAAENRVFLKDGGWAWRMAADIPSPTRVWRVSSTGRHTYSQSPYHYISRATTSGDTSGAFFCEGDGRDRCCP